MVYFDKNQITKVPQLALDVRIRSEVFGGLVFKVSDMAVYEINELTRKLLAFIDGEMELESLIQKSMNELVSNRPIIEDLLQKMIKAGVIIL